MAFRGKETVTLGFLDLNIGSTPHVTDGTALLAFELDSLKLKMLSEWVHRSVPPNNVVFIDGN